MISGLNDPEHVREQYATEHGLAARKSVYQNVSGEDAREIAFRAIADVHPGRILEVGCGEGELAARMGSELEAEVEAIDQSPRMVELTRTRGVAARVADVQSLPFPDGRFDIVVAAWMLYHVPDIDAGLAEIVRVLASGGRLVAVTNGSGHLAELLALAGIERWELPFGGDNGEEILRRHFGRVDSIPCDGTVVVADIETVRRYYESSDRLAYFVERLPAELDQPLVVQRCPIVFVAHKDA